MRPVLVLGVALAVLGACGREAAAPAAGSGSGAGSAGVAAIDAALSRGGRFLAARQRADGAIPSETYAALGDGWSLTPLAVLALRMAAPDGAPGAPGTAAPEPIAAAYQRGVDFVATLAGPGGTLRAAPEVAYPLYSYAIGALVLGAPDNRRHRAAHARLLEGLRGLQVSERTGWRPTEVSFGGWGYSSRPPVRTGGSSTFEDEAFAANLSATLLATAALTLGGVPAGDPALAAARGFVERCQNTDTDGGFFFSPAGGDANKAGALPGGRFRSYGSMTADGVRALLRLGRAPEDPRVAAAIAYLDRRFDAAQNPGDFPDIAEVRRASAYYYWTWSIAHVARHLGRRNWAEALSAELLRRQAPDGSWRNPSSEMREDDPIIATSFAVAALALSRSVLATAPRSHAY